MNKKGTSAAVNMKGLDALDRHLDQLWRIQKENNEKQQQQRSPKEWEMDPAKLLVKQAIGRGAFSQVHRGVYDGQDVAVKLLDWGSEEHEADRNGVDSLRTLFTKEVSVWFKLEHPNVTKCIGCMTGKPEIKFERKRDQVGVPRNIAYQPGGTLTSYLKKHGRTKLPFPTILKLSLDLARGLRYLHSGHVVHRDIKPENILLDQNQTLKINDFGVATRVPPGGKLMTEFAGTLGYMAPEVFENKPYNRKCDVYSFGICLCEICCCPTPYANIRFSKLTSSTLYKHTRPNIPEWCPSPIADLMRKCWDTDPNLRPEMEDVVSMLEFIGSEAVLSDHQDNMATPTHQPGCLSMVRQAFDPVTNVIARC
ncbi:hypothetical protein Tsubulata_023261 [Turnera subulata]|uniref:Protein kinase domain-containing protein n=1 Tax=Turnera subulata TaxID=218843 RepID=A0A9Q0FBP9_9ROSI|nr:hypothetical protein Tsubulata_023261 [Turnera subulata]